MLNFFVDIVFWLVYSSFIRTKERIKPMAMSKSEKTAIAVAHQLLNWATSSEVASKSDFLKGLAAGYREAAEEILFRVKMNDFSE